MIVDTMSNLNEDNLDPNSDDVDLEKFIEPYLIKYPDYYNFRGDLFENISKSEKIMALKILKSEFDLI